MKFLRSYTQFENRILSSREELFIFFLHLHSHGFNVIKLLRVFIRFIQPFGIIRALYVYIIDHSGRRE